jgi:hypothetical protein
MKKILKEYVRQVIKEVYNYNEIENLKKQLDIIVSKYFYKYMAKPDENLYDIATREVVAKLLEMGYVSLPNKEDEGASRDVYHKQKDSYVIKVSKGHEKIIKSYKSPNKSEIDISTGKHGDAINIVPNILYYDTFYKDNPIWLVAEKVIPLKKANASQLQYSFPTFFKTFKEDLIDNIADITRDIFFNLSIDMMPEDIHLHQMSLQDFVNVYCELISLQYTDDEVNMDYIERLKDGHDKAEDLQKILICMKYIQTYDLHAGNIGIKVSSRPTPDDIVILDFDANY